MWATPARYQAEMKGKLRSLSWLQCKDSKNAGWLATTDNQLIGISWIGESDSKHSEKAGIGLSQNACLYKSCFNLKGEKYSEILIARFSPEGGKLLSYDSSGHAKLWTNRKNVYCPKYKVSINYSVRDLQWSSCGNYIAVCGDRIQILSGIDFECLHSGDIEPYMDYISCAWNDCSTQLAFGTTQSEVVLVSHNPGIDPAFMLIDEKDESVKSLHFYGPVKEIQVFSRHDEQRIVTESQAVSAYLNNGDVVFDLRVRRNRYAARVQTHLVEGLAEWNSDKTILAVVGYQQDSPQILSARFFTQEGETITLVDRVLQIPEKLIMPLYTMCWGQRDTTIFLGCGGRLYSTVVQYSLPRLQDMCRQLLKATLNSSPLFDEDKIAIAYYHPKGSDNWICSKLPLPDKEIEAVHCSLPKLVKMPFNLIKTDALVRLFRPLDNKRRLLCSLSHSIDRMHRESYMLRFEYLGQYIPLLRADNIVKKRSKVTATIKQAFPFVPTVDMWYCLGDHANERKIPGLEEITARPLSARRYRAALIRHTRESNRYGQPVWCTLDENGLFNAFQPILARIKGNVLKNRYKFSSLYYDNFDMGDLDIHRHSIKCTPREMVMTLPNFAVQLASKKPYWNPHTELYEINSGERVTHNSVHNYLIEHERQVVFQLGKIGERDFALDFQYPFSPVTALCMAISSIVSVNNE